jgi:hypothetical protein
MKHLQRLFFETNDDATALGFNSISSQMTLEWAIEL